MNLLRGLAVAVVTASIALIAQPIGAQHARENPENELVRFYCYTADAVGLYARTLHTTGEADPAEFGCGFLPFDGYGKYTFVSAIDDTDFSVYHVRFDNNESLFTFR